MKRMGPAVAIVDRVTLTSLDLFSIESEVRIELDSMNEAREFALKLGCPIIRNSANAIRALHRGTSLALES